MSGHSKWNNSNIEKVLKIRKEQSYLQNLEELTIAAKEGGSILTSIQDLDS